MHRCVIWLLRDEHCRESLLQVSRINYYSMDRLTALNFAIRNCLLNVNYETLSPNRTTESLSLFFSTEWNELQNWTFSGWRSEIQNFLDARLLIRLHFSALFTFSYVSFCSIKVQGCNMAKSNDFVFRTEPRNQKSKPKSLIFF